MTGAWKRSDWNDIVSRVNSLAASPPANTDCEPLGALPLVGTDHIWTKSDITAVRSKLTQICNSNSFQAELRLWAQNVVDELNAAIAAGWCGCDEEDQCRPDCSNAQGSVTEYAGSYTAEGCYVSDGGSTGATTADRLAIVTASSAANLACNRFSAAQMNACVANDELEALQDELEALQDQLDAATAYMESVCGPGGNPATCAAAQEEVANLQGSVDAKQQEVDEKRQERDDYQNAADGYLAEANTQANSSISAYEAIIVDSGIQAAWTSFVPPAEWADRDCADMGPPCLSRNPSRCRPSYWSVSRRTISYYAIYPPATGSWSEVIRGAYTPTGQPYVTSSINIGSTNGIPVHSCSSYGPNACANGCYPGTYTVYEVRVTIAYPNPAGEECCE